MPGWGRGGGWVLQGTFRRCWGQGLDVQRGREVLGQTSLKIRICFKYLDLGVVTLCCLKIKWVSFTFLSLDGNSCVKT